MKVQLASDLHLEFGDIEIKNAGADVLILSGDICVGKEFFPGWESEKSKRYLNFFEQVCKEFKNVVYVFGNHEHYHGDFATTSEFIKTGLEHLSNLHILDIGSVDIDGVLFVGGTLWTDFDNGDPVVKWDAQRMMNDYRTVRNGGDNVFLPDDAIRYHETMLMAIDDFVQESNGRPVVVVGHHAPSTSSISGRYVNDRLNGAYASDLSQFILDHPQIKLWTHGHIHTSSDYMVGSTRIVCNPRGYYNYEENPEFDPSKVLEL